MDNKEKHNDKKPVAQGAERASPEANKIGASTPYDFGSKNLTAYGGLLLVATMLEKLGFEQLLAETLTVKRATRAMPRYQFILAIYVGFARLHHLQFLQREPMLTGILQVLRRFGEKVLRLDYYSARHFLVFIGHASSPKAHDPSKSSNGRLRHPILPPVHHSRKMWPRQSPASSVVQIAPSRPCNRWSRK